MNNTVYGKLMKLHSSIALFINYIEFSPTLQDILFSQAVLYMFFFEQTPLINISDNLVYMVTKQTLTSIGKHINFVHLKWLTHQMMTSILNKHKHTLIMDVITTVILFGHLITI